MKTTATRIEVWSTVSDPRAPALQRRLTTDGFRVKNVWITDVYTIDKRFSQSELRGIAGLLHHPLTQTAAIAKPLAPKKFSWAIEIGYLPGVTDNIGNTCREMIADFTGKAFNNQEAVYTSRVVFLDGGLSQRTISLIAKSFYNPLIERSGIKNFLEFTRDRGMDVRVPKVELTGEKRVDEVSLQVTDKKLAELGSLGIPNPDGTRRGPLALSVQFLKAIRRYFESQGRNPTDMELESIAQTWSEHCKHTIFNSPIDTMNDGLFRTYIKAATHRIRKIKGKQDICASVFTDNSGAIVFDNKHLVTYKVETHNSPSALDPFGGSLTGIVGVNRDTIGFGLGALPVINTYGFCLADPTDKTELFRGSNKTQPMMSARRIMEGVVAGVNAGGNCSGIPTPQGFLFFDRRFRGKPLVFVGTVGLIPKVDGRKPSYSKQARPGDYIVMVGGRVGLDGIHGATFSSESLHSASPATAVQIGDPITQKKLSDAIVKEARAKGLFHSITDNGAGGLSCSVAEMAEESNGCLVELEKVPLKYPGLSPWQIWISESQERMTLAVPKNKWSPLSNLLQRRGCEATIIGRFTDSGNCIVTYHGKTVMDVGLQFLHNGVPVQRLRTRQPAVMNRRPKIFRNEILTHAFLKLLSRPSIAGFSFISQQYDHEVQSGSVLKPLQGRGRVNADVTITRPVLASPRAVVLSQGFYPVYSEIDPYRMAATSVDTAVRNAVAAGADPDRIALLDNFCWCSSHDPKRLWQLKQSAKACYDYAVAYGTPFISGKDSMFNDFHGFDKHGKPVTISVPPTLLISSLGIINSCAKAVSLDAKFAGDFVYLLGSTYDEFGGSEYLAMNGETRAGVVPRVDAKKNWSLYKALARAIGAGLVASSQSVHRGGLAVAIAKTALGGKLGVDLTLRGEYALFSESQGRILITVAPQNAKPFETVMKDNACSRIGSVTDHKCILVKNQRGNTLVNCSLDQAHNSYTSTFREC